MKPEKKYYTLKELESILHLTRRSLQTYITNGKLKAYRLGNKWIVSEADLEAFVKSLNHN